jgi:hypothetical protein
MGEETPESETDGGAGDTGERLAGCQRRLRKEMRAGSLWVCEL